MKKLICLALAIVLTLSFTAFAADFTCLSTTVDNGATGVFVKEGTITFTFTDVVDEGTLSTITIIKDSDPFDLFTAALNGENENAFDITFDNVLDYSANYVISFGNVESASGSSLTGTNSLSFKTEPKPAIELEGITLTKGIGSSVSEPDSLAADNTIQGFKVELKNNAETAKTVNIICALYNSNNVIKRVVTSEKAIDASSTEIVELGTFIDDTYAGGKAKIYVWDNVSNSSPFVGATTFLIP